MQRYLNKKILVFSNGEKIGDGIIKLQLLYEIKRRLPDYKLYWITDKGKTVYSSLLKNIASQYIDVYYEQAEISPIFWKKISYKYNLHNEYFDYILDTQKSFFRTLALKRIKHGIFVSGSANGLFSSKKIKINKNHRYYLDYIFDLLDLVLKKKKDDNFKLPIDANLEKLIFKILSSDNKYVGIAPGAGEQNKIWSINNFIEVCEYIQSKNLKLVFFIGPSEIHLKDKLNDLFPNSIFIEDMINGYNNIEIIMAATKFLKLAISNDSGVSHMLSTGYCPLIKLFGPKDAKKFTPNRNNLNYISSSEFRSSNINKITTDRVIKEINKLLESNN